MVFYSCKHTSDSNSLSCNGLGVSETTAIGSVVRAVGGVLIGDKTENYGD